MTQAAGTAADPFSVLTDVVSHGDVLILSGAGLSTESGIPDYRGPTGLARRATPMTYQVFTGSAEARRRYWARSHVGWRHIARALPNDGHRAVADLGRRGALTGLITQNVDGLHQAAGATHVTELHGSLHRVVCLSCRQRTPRTDLDRRLRQANPGWDVPDPRGSPSTLINPDGNAVLTDAAVATFHVVDCTDCGGVLKPDVVFFGENVPKQRVTDCHALVDQARSLVVLGSSLTVMSGFRFLRHAAKRRLPIVIVNQGATRGDAHATATLDAPLGPTLTTLVHWPHGIAEFNGVEAIEGANGLRPG